MHTQKELKIRLTIKLYQMDGRGIQAAFKGIDNAEEMSTRMHIRRGEHVREFILETMSSLTLEELQRIDKNIKAFTRKQEEPTARMVKAKQNTLDSRPLELTVDELCDILVEKEIPEEKVAEIRKKYESIRRTQMNKKAR